MQPILVVRNTVAKDFQDWCEKCINDGYLLHSSNSACTGDCQDEMYQAIMVLPAAIAKVENLNSLQHLKAEISFLVTWENAHRGSMSDLRRLSYILDSLRKLSAV
jgi:hypothetical protein